MAEYTTTDDYARSYSDSDDYVRRYLALDVLKARARIRELEAALAKEKGGWDAFYKLRKSVGENRYPGMTAEVTTQDRGAEHE
jgi:hypothetical protein